MASRYTWVVLLILALTPAWAQTPGTAPAAGSNQVGALHGKVFDERGLVMVGATVTVLDANDATVATALTG